MHLHAAKERELELIDDGEVTFAQLLSSVAARGLFAGDAPYGWLDAADATGWAVVGNVISGLGLVTMLRMVQIGSETIDRERRTAESGT